MKHLSFLLIRTVIFLCMLISISSCFTQDENRSQATSQSAKITRSGITFVYDKEDRVSYFHEKYLGGDDWRSEIRTRSGDYVVINGKKLFVNNAYYGDVRSNDILRVDETVNVNGFLIKSQPYASIEAVLHPKKEHWVNIGKFSVCVYTRSKFAYFEPFLGNAYIELDGKKLAVNKAGDVRFNGVLIGNMQGKYIDEEFGKITLKKGVPDWSKERERAKGDSPE